ncbi:hypothetical protein LF1_03670 [Rubripirellula obstinata]|uniref:Aerotolerance regulator N-terminal domain-containing protein n=1 Tax=Rubripirellula obstinata TaxID=406547 RepID=A0A5B1C9Q5_9BACT|nr:BatA domain-containing protein [Rubripirellula obstinata]KAA1257877.1 hypothetical protein LF1_03670 [Rubripirellula obstinata]
MSFLGAMFLLALPVIGIPVAIHMMKKRQRDVVPWGAMQFLRDPTRRGQRMSQMDRWLLLATRMLLLACLIGALAQPLLKWGQTSENDGLPTQLVLIDDTRSTLADDCFESIRKAADELIASFPASTPVEVWAAGTPARRIASTSSGADSMDQIQSAVANFSPRGGGGDFAAAVRQATATATIDQDTSNLDIWLFTDDTDAGWEMPLSASAMAVGKGQRLHLMQIEKTQQVKHQLAVVSVESSRRAIASGESVSLSATVANGGSIASPEVSCVWKKGGVVIAESVLRSIQPNSQQLVQTELSIDQAGTHAITFELKLQQSGAADMLAADDVGHVVMQVVKEVPMLVIQNAENQFGSAPTDADYLAAALGRNLGGWKTGVDESKGKGKTNDRSKASWHSLFKPEVVDIDDLDDVRWQRYPVIVWLGGATLPPASLRSIVNQVRRGAGLWITLDAQTDRDWINESLGQRGLGIGNAGDLLAGNSRSGDLVGGLVINASAKQMQRLHPPDPTDSILAALSDTQRLDLDAVRIRRRVELQAPSMESASRVMLRTFEGDPIAILSSVGRGRTVVQSLPMNPSWSNFALSKCFVVWVLQVLDHLSQPVSENFNLAAGQMFRHDVESIDHEFELTLPDGAKEGLIALPSGENDGSTLAGVVRFDQTQRAGLYRLKDLDDDQIAEVFFSVSGASEESKIIPASPDRWQALASRKDVSFHRSASGFDFPAMLSTIPKIDVTGNQGLRLWPALLVGLIAAIILETFLAGYAALRRYGKLGTVEEDENVSGLSNAPAFGNSPSLAKEAAV